MLFLCLNCLTDEVWTSAKSTNRSILEKATQTMIWPRSQSDFRCIADLLSTCPQTDISRIDRPGRISSSSWWFHIHWTLDSCIQCYLEEDREDKRQVFLKSQERQWSNSSVLSLVISLFVSDKILIFRFTALLSKKISLKCVTARALNGLLQRFSLKQTERSKSKL